MSEKTSEDPVSPITTVQISGKKQDGAGGKEEPIEDPDQQLAKILQQLRNGTLKLDEEFKFLYKGRVTRGRAIHIAALHPKGGLPFSPPDDPTNKKSLVAKLVELGFDADERSYQQARGFQTAISPIHIAAGMGNVKAMEALIAEGSHPDLRTRSKPVDAPGDGTEHYAPLHDACFFNQTAAVLSLIQAKADVNAKNVNGETPLHTSARMGNWCVCSMLVDNEADRGMGDSKGKTSLEVALSSDYPTRKLFILSRLCMEDFMLVCKEDPGSAKALFSTSSESGIDWGAQWRKALTTPSGGFALPTIDNLVELCEIAPRSLAHLLDLLSMPPNQPETEKFSNPMPKHAFTRMGFWNSDFMRTLYSRQNFWHKDAYPSPEADEGHGDKFRYELCQCKKKKEKRQNGTPMTPKAGEVDFLKAGHSLANKAVRGIVSKNERQSASVSRVSMKMLHLPNIVNLDFIDSLAHVRSKEDKKALFSRQAVQALINFMWNFHVVRFHNHDLCMLLMELSIFLWLAIDEPNDDIGKNAAWSLSAAFSYRMLVKEIGALIGTYQNFGSVKYYFLSFYNWWQAVMVIICVTYTHQLFHFTNLKDQARLEEEKVSRALLAGASFIRWVKLMTSLSAYSVLGPQLLAITTSFWKISGMTTVLIFYFLAFAHVFAALRVTISGTAKTIYEVALNSIKLLLTGDGDGINFALALGGRHEDGDLVTLLWLLAAIFLFIICVLNLFIAVHGEAYGEAAEMETENFYSNRAKVCKQVMMSPSLLCCCKINPLKIYPMILLPGFGIWAGLVNIPVMEIRYVAATQLLVFLIFADMVIAKAPWEVIQNKSSKVYAVSKDNEPGPAGDEEEEEPDGETNWYLWWYTFVAPFEDDNSEE